MLVLLLRSFVTILLCETYYLYAWVDFVTFVVFTLPQIFTLSKYFAIAYLNSKKEKKSLYRPGKFLKVPEV